MIAVKAAKLNYRIHICFCFIAQIKVGKIASKLLKFLHIYLITKKKVQILSIFALLIKS